MVQNEKLYETTLANGIRLVYLWREGTNNAVVSTIFKAGIRYEKPEQEGITHFMEHILLNGSKKYPSKKEISEIVTNTGGYRNGMTSPQNVFFLAMTPKEHIEKAFEYNSETVLHSLFNNFETEKGVVIAEQYRKKDNHRAQKYENIVKKLFPCERAKMRVLGTEDTINSINLEDMKSYAEKIITAENTTLLTTSSIPFEQIKTLANKYFEKMQGTKPAFTEPIFEYKQAKDTQIPLNIQQESVYFVFPLKTYNNKNRIMHSFFFDYLMSATGKLYLQLRNKGLIYAGTFSLNPSPFFTQLVLDCKPENADKIISLVKNELPKMLNNITQTDLDTYKARKTGQLSMDIPTYNRFYELQQKIKTGIELTTLQDEIAQINNLTLTEIQAYAKEAYNLDNASLVRFVPKDTPQ